jgi:hypothetical protein
VSGLLTGSVQSDGAVGGVEESAVREAGGAHGALSVVWSSSSGVSDPLALGCLSDDVASRGGGGGACCSWG